MKKALLLTLACLAGSVFANDLVLDIKLNGSELADGEKTGRISARGILVIEDYGAETNILSGLFYMQESKGKGNGKAKGQKTRYVKQEAAVRLLKGKQASFGLLVELDSATMAGTGKMQEDNNGKLKQVIISSGHGIFLYTDMEEDRAETNVVDGVSSNIDAIVEIDTTELLELEAGKMQARLNKKLTEKAMDSSGSEAVEAWFEEKGILKEEEEDPKKVPGRKEK